MRHVKNMIVVVVVVRSFFNVSTASRASCYEEQGIKQNKKAFGLYVRFLGFLKREQTRATKYKSLTGSILERIAKALFVHIYSYFGFV